MKRTHATKAMLVVLRLAHVGRLFQEPSGNWIDDRTDLDPWPSAARACVRRGWLRAGAVLGMDTQWLLTPAGRRVLERRR